jgi:Effector-associated domain 1
MKLQSKYYQKALETIASLHPTAGEAKLFTRSAGMEPAKTQLTGEGLVIWDSVLSLSEKEGRVRELLEYTASKNPGNTEIKQLLAGLDDETVFIKGFSYADYIKPPSATTVNLFFVYDADNAAQVKPLKTQLKILENNGKIAMLDMHGVEASQDIEKERLKFAGEADVFLLMLTAAFLASDECMELAFAGVDMQKRVVPVLLSPCLWSRIEILENIVPLPKNGTPVSKWPDKDDAMYEVAQGVESLVQLIQKGKSGN